MADTGTDFDLRIPTSSQTGSYPPSNCDVYFLSTSSPTTCPILRTCSNCQVCLHLDHFSEAHAGHQKDRNQTHDILETGRPHWLLLTSL